MNNNKQLRNNHSQLINLKLKVNDAIDSLRRKSSLINELYKTILSKNSASTFTFGLDQLNFQNRLLINETDHLVDSVKIINNRIYGDYYKLYQIIKRYIDQRPRLLDFINQNGKLTVYPPYKDLEIRKQYDDDLLTRLYNEIINIIYLLKTHINNLDEQLDEYRNKLEIGLHLSNFIYTVEDCNIEISNKLDLFDKYIHYLSKNHEKYLNNILTKINRFLADLNHDINIDVNLKKELSDNIKQIQPQYDTTHLQENVNINIEKTSNDSLIKTDNKDFKEINIDGVKDNIEDNYIESYNVSIPDNKDNMENITDTNENITENKENITDNKENITDNNDNMVGGGMDKSDGDGS